MKLKADIPDLALIREMMRAVGLTQRQLAHKSGVSQSKISKILDGKIDPSYSSVKAVFSALNEETEKQLKKEKTAGELMTKGVMQMESEKTVAEASRLMVKNGFSQLPVTKNGFIVGSITEKTILKAYSEGKTDKQRLEEIMELPFPVVSENTPKKDLETLLTVRQAIIIQEKDKIKGIITATDLLK